MEIDTCIKKIEYTITTAGLNYDIWWTYKKKKYRKLLLEADDFYPLFIKSSLHAHFVSTIIPLYRLLETKDTRISFYYLLNLVKKDNKFNNVDINNFERRIKSLKPLWIKISILRNNVFGHETNNLNINPWKEAKITPNDIGSLIKKFQELLNYISCRTGGSSYVFYLSAKNDAINLLKDLRTFHARIKNSKAL